MPEPEVTERDGHGQSFLLDDLIYPASVLYQFGELRISMFSRFILQSKEEINDQLTDKQKTADTKIKELEVQQHTSPHANTLAYMLTSSPRCYHAC